MRKKFGLQIFSLILAVVLVGCATRRIDWNSRVGIYTYDQAITEMGPPDRVAKLSDDTIVAEWLTYRGRSGDSYWFHGPYYTHPIYEPPMPDRFVRLTFTPDGKLKAWKKVAR